MANPASASETERPSTSKGSLLDAFLRLFLLAASVAAVVLMVTSKENKVFQVQVPGVGIVGVSKPAKFNYSPAFIYLVAAASASGLYSIITGLASFSVARKPALSPKWPLILIAHDVIILGILASATGTAGGVAYIGLKGNSHVNWGKICNQYGKYCKHVGSSVALTLIASIILVFLIIRNSYSLYRAIQSKY